MAIVALAIIVVGYITLTKGNGLLSRTAAYLLPFIAKSYVSKVRSTDEELHLMAVRRASICEWVVLLIGFVVPITVFISLSISIYYYGDDRSNFARMLIVNLLFLGSFSIWAIVINSILLRSRIEKIQHESLIHSKLYQIYLRALQIETGRFRSPELFGKIGVSQEKLREATGNSLNRPIDKVVIWPLLS